MQLICFYRVKRRCQVEMRWPTCRELARVGQGGSGQLGRKSLSNQVWGDTVYWVEVYTWAQVSAGNAHTCGIASDTLSLWCWGALLGAFCGLCAALGWAVPLVCFCQMAGGHVELCWPDMPRACAPGAGAGEGSQGRLGRNSTADSTIPVAVSVPSGVTAWIMVSAGGSHTCAIAAVTGSLWCFGAFQEGCAQLGGGRGCWMVLFWVGLGR